MRHVRVAAKLARTKVLKRSSPQRRKSTRGTLVIRKGRGSIHLKEDRGPYTGYLMAAFNFAVIGDKKKFPDLNNYSLFSKGMVQLSEVLIARLVERKKVGKK